MSGAARAAGSDPGASAPGDAEAARNAVEAAAAFAEQMPEATRRRELVWQDPLPSAQLGASLSGLEYMRRVAAGEIPPPPIAVLLSELPPQRFRPG